MMGSKSFAGSLLASGRRLAASTRARRRAALLALAVLAPACGGGGGGGGGTPPPAFAIVTGIIPPAVVNAAYASTLSAQGGSPPYVWNIVSGGLPPGMALSPSTGAITGTANGNGSYSFVVRLTDTANNAAVHTYSLVVSGGPGGGLTVATVTLPTGTVGASYNGALSATGGTPPYSWTQTAGTIPGGLNLQGTGMILGTPSAVTGGPVGLTFQVTDSASGTASATVNLTINAAPLITTPSLPGGEVGVPYSQTLATSGGTAPFVFSIAGGALPGGLTLDGTTGTISGSPTGLGAFSFTASFTDAAGAVATKALSIAVASDPVISTTTLPAGTVGSIYSPPSGFQLVGSGGTGALTWTPAGGTMPPGLGLSGAGVISGTPTGSNGFYSFTVKATDGDGKFATQNLSISVSGGTVTALSITTSSPLPSGDIGVGYATSLSASGGTPPYTWIVTGAPPLPSGLALSGAGQITGTPTAATGAPVTVNFKVTDSAGVPQTATTGLAISVNNAVTFTTTTLSAADNSFAYNHSVSALGGSGTFTYMVTSGALPAGLSLNGATGAITGTPTGTGTSNFTITALDGLGGQASGALSIAVNPPLAVTTTSLPAWTANKAGYSAAATATGGSGGFTWSSTGVPPTGLAFSAAGVLSGTPTAAGSFSFTAKATDSLGNLASNTVSVQINPAISVTTTSISNWTQNSSGYSQPLAATGGTGALGWAVTAGALPTGMALSPTGVVSGTPVSAPGAYTFTATATDTVGATGSNTVHITINAIPSITDASPLPNGDPSVLYTDSLTPAGGTGTLTYSLVSGAFPSGIGIVGGTNVISGTTAASGLFSFTLKITDSTGASSTKAFQLTINNAITVTTGSPLATGEQGVSYAGLGVTLAASGGSGGYTWSQTSLPAGMTLSAAGAVGGIPGGTGTTPVTFTATDSLGGTGSKIINVTINAPVTVTGATPAWTVNQPYNTVITASSGVPAYTWTAVTGLPAGVTQTPAATTLTLGGTPTATGTFPLNFKVTDSVTGTFTLGTSLVINPAVGLTGAVPTAWNRLTAFSATLTPSGGTSPFTWTVSGLPPGIITTPATGGTGATLAFSGTPTTKGNYTVSVTVTDAAGSTKNQTYPVQINDPLVITGSLPGAWDQNAPFTPTLGAQGGTPPYNWVVTAPPGLTPAGLTTATLSFTGSPVIVGGSGFTIQLNDSAAGSVNISPAITINAPLAMTGQGGFPAAWDQNALFNPAPLGTTGGTTPYTWTVLGLPTGITPNPTGGPGTPSLAFTGSSSLPPVGYLLSIKVSDAGGGSVTFTPTLTLNPTLGISGNFPTAWDQGVTFNFAPPLAATGGTGTMTWAVTNLPAGVGQGNVTGSPLTWTGFPTTPGPIGVQITLTDQGGGSVTINPNITIGATLTMTGQGSFPLGWDRNAGFNPTLGAAGGSTPYAWVVSGLPTGILATPSGGTNTSLNFSGQTSVPAGSFPLTITLTDAGHGQVVFTPTLQINNFLNVSNTFPSGWDQGQPFTPSVAATNGTGTITWTVLNLPAGISPSPAGATLNFTGSPTTAGGPTSVSIKAQDQGGGSVTITPSIMINGPLNITTGGLPAGNVNTFYSITLQTSGGTPPFNWVSTGNPLPAGINFSPTGTISGMVGAPSNTTGLTYKVTDQGGGNATSVSLTLAINGPLTLTPSSGALAAGANGVLYGGSTVTISGGTLPITPNVGPGLPPGINFAIAGSNINFTGTPTQQGLFSFPIKVTDVLGATASGTFSITVTGAGGSLAVLPNTGNPTILPAGTVNAPYSFGFTGTGGNPSGPYTFAISPGAPFGLSFNTSTGVLSGTMTGPTPVPPVNFTITLNDGASPQAQTNYQLTMNNPLVIQGTGLPLPQGDVGVAYSALVTSGGGTSPYSWTETGSLPNGISTFTVGAGNSQIKFQGTSTVAGTFPVAVTVTDSAGASQSNTGLQLVFVPQPSITIIPLNPGTQGTPYGPVTLNATGGTGVYTWGATGLPTGITLDTGGHLSGTTTQQGTFPLNITVTDAVGGSGNWTPSLVINQGPLTITSTTLPPGDVGHAYSQQIGFFGGKSPYTFQVTSGALPPGAPAFAISNTGLVTGTPNTAGSYGPFTVMVTDSTSGTPETASQSFTIVIGTAPSITNLVLPDGQVGSFYYGAIEVSGGTPTVTYALTAGTAPAGLNFNNTNGAFFGTPTTPGTTTGLTVTATDGAGVQAQQTYSIKIKPTPGNPNNFAIGMIRMPDAVAGQAYSGKVYTTGNNGTTYTYTVDDPTKLPAGFSMTTGAGGGGNLPNPGILSCTTVPNTPGEYTFTVNATDTGGNAAQGNVLLVVVGASATPLSITTASFPGGTVGTNYPPVQLQAAGGRSPYTWVVAGRNGVPFGMSMTQQGIFYGVPGQAGTFTMDLSVLDSSNPPQGAFVSIPFTVAGAGTFQITSTSFGTVNVGGAAANITLTTSGGTAPIFWLADTKALGASGLTFNPTGSITGSATAMALVTFPMAAVDSSNPTKMAGGEGSLTVGTTGAIHVTTLVAPPIVMGRDYSYQLAATGGTGAYTWSFPPPGSKSDDVPGSTGPNGLSVNAGTGLLTWTAAQQQQSNGGNNQNTCIFKVTDGTNTTLFVLTFSEVGGNNNGNNLSYNFPDLLWMSGTQGSAFSNTIGNAGFNNSQDDTWSLIFPFPGGMNVTPSTVYSLQALGAGLTIDPQRGAITGTPNIPGHFDLHMDLLAISSGGHNGNANEPIQSSEQHALMDIFPPGGPGFQISTRCLPPGRAGNAYGNVTMVTTGGTGTNTWSVAGGTTNLPPGLALDTVNGILSGTPTTAGTYAFNVTVSQGAGGSASMHYEVAIDPALPLTIVTPRLPDGTIGQVYSGQLYAAGGGGPLTWSDASSPTTFASLGLALNTGTGAVTGTPTAAPNVYPILVSVTDGTNTCVRHVGVLLNKLPITMQAFAAGVVGTPMLTPIQGFGGTGPYSFSFGPGTPVNPGWALTGAGGATITGTPSALTSFRDMLVIVTDNTGATGWGGIQGFSIPPAFPALSFQFSGGGGNNNLLVASPISSQSFGAQGGTVTAGYTYSTTPAPPAGPNDIIPPGLTFTTNGTGSGAQGVLAGTPTETGFFTYQMRVTDNATPTPATADQFLDLSVTPYGNGGGGGNPFAVSTPRIPNALHGSAYPSTQLNYSYNFGPGPGPTITWNAVSGLPAGWTLNAQGQISGPTGTALGTYYIIVTAFDGTNTVQGRVKLVVTP